MQEIRQLILLHIKFKWISDLFVKDKAKKLSDDNMENIFMNQGKEKFPK